MEINIEELKEILNFEGRLDQLQRDIYDIRNIMIEIKDGKN